MKVSDATPVDEQIRALALGEQREIFAAVAEGRAVADPRLAPFTIAYAVRWQTCLGPSLYRSPWYLAAALMGTAIACASASWPGALVAAAGFAISPQLTRGRRARAQRAERRNRELLCGAKTTGQSGETASESSGTWPSYIPRAGACSPNSWRSADCAAYHPARPCTPGPGGVADDAR